MDKTIRIFGYGSLINEKSLKKTISNPRNIFPCKLYGFVRVFNIKWNYSNGEKINEKFCVLNLEKSEWNESINGICFDINIQDLEKLKKREKGYEFIGVEVCDLKNEKNKYKAYTFRAKHFETYEFQYDSETQKEYLQICLDGCKEFGEEFLEEFRKTTFISDKTLHDLGM